VTVPRKPRSSCTLDVTTRPTSHSTEMVARVTREGRRAARAAQCLRCVRRRLHRGSRTRGTTTSIDSPTSTASAITYLCGMVSGDAWGRSPASMRATPFWMDAKTSTASRPWVLISTTIP
jgi:hypothetical protein